jgi:hypothetical protein
VPTPEVAPPAAVVAQGINGGGAGSVPRSEPSALPGRRADVIWTLAAVALVAAAAALAPIVRRAGGRLFLNAPPLLGDWKPHVGIGSPFAIAAAVVAVALFPRLIRRLRWRPLIIAGWAASGAWTVSLALVDGWQRGWVSRLQDRNEYLHDLPRITGVGSFLTDFTSHIRDFRPGSWTTHVSSHPPAATLAFYLLDRIGLHGGAWAGVLVVLVGTTAAVAVPVTLRALGAPRAARRVLPFTVFFPGAVWVGVSADGMFAGVAATGVAVAVLGVVGRRRLSGWLAALGGMVLGLMVYLSYGLALVWLVVGATAWCSARMLALRGPWLRRWLLRWLLVCGGAMTVVVAFSAAGFWWFDGLSELHVRYYQGIAARRPYSYFVWANLAAFALSAGPVAAAGAARAVRVLGRHGAGARRFRSRRIGRVPSPGRPVGAETVAPAVIAVAAVMAVLIADISALSKAETERIWLSFGFFLMCGLALLPRRAGRWALSVQVGCALVVNHLVLTQW